MIGMFLLRHANQHKRNPWRKISSWGARDILETMYDTQEAQPNPAYSQGVSPLFWIPFLLVLKIPPLLRMLFHMSMSQNRLKILESCYKHQALRHRKKQKEIKTDYHSVNSWAFSPKWSNLFSYLKRAPESSDMPCLVYPN